MLRSWALTAARAQVKMLMKCIKCFLWCFEKCVKYITKTAYIMIAMQGDNFCSSAISAFKVRCGYRFCRFCRCCRDAALSPPLTARVVPAVQLLRDNLAQIAVLNAVSVFILLLSKIFVSCTCGFIAFLMLDNSSQFKQTGSQPLSSVWLPVLVVMLAAYFVTTAFAYVYDIAIDAMLMCCCQVRAWRIVRIVRSTVHHADCVARAGPEAERAHWQLCDARVAGQGIRRGVQAARGQGPGGGCGARGEGPCLSAVPVISCSLRPPLSPAAHTRHGASLP